MYSKEDFENDIDSLEHNIDKALVTLKDMPENYSKPYITLLRSLKTYIEAYRASESEETNE